MGTRTTVTSNVDATADGAVGVIRPVLHAILTQTPVRELNLSAVVGSRARHAALARELLRAPCLPHAAYVASVIGELLRLVRDADGLDDEDGADETYHEVLGLAISGAVRCGYVTWHVAQAGASAPAPISVRQSHLLSDVPLRVWPAAPALVDAVAAIGRDASRAALVRGRAVLELGAGTGLVGLAVAAAGVGVARVLLTDAAAESVARMADAAADNAGVLRGVPVRAAELEWAAFAAGRERGAAADFGADGSRRPRVSHLGVDDDGGGSVFNSELTDAPPLLVIGSDVVYDPEALPALAGTLRALLRAEGRGGGDGGGGERGPLRGACVTEDGCAGAGDALLAAAAVAPRAPAALLATTVRNPRTYAAFLSALAAAGLVHADVTVAVRELLAAGGGGAVCGGAGGLGNGGLGGCVGDVRVGLVL